MNGFLMHATIGGATTPVIPGNCSGSPETDNGSCECVEWIRKKKIDQLIAMFELLC